MKLQVRDAVVEYLTPLLAQVQTREEAEQLLAEQLPQLEALAAGMTADFGYGAQAEMGRFDFPARRYGQLQLPAGEYPALRLVLGEGEGHNWWCVLYPSLCFQDASNAVVPEEGKQQLKNVLTEEEYAHMTTEADFQIKWYFWERWKG